MTLKLRQLSLSRDYDQLLALWDECNLVYAPKESDSIKSLQQLVDRQASLCLVVGLQNWIVGAVLGGFDGRRGFIYRLAVQREYLDTGIAQNLLRQLEQNLINIGCLRCYYLDLDNYGSFDVFSDGGYRQIPSQLLWKHLKKGATALLFEPDLLSKDEEGFSFHEFQIDHDYERTVLFWQANDLYLDPYGSDSLSEMRKKAGLDVDLFLLVERHGQIVGTVMGGFDGLSGFVYHLCVSRDERRNRLGTALMQELEWRLMQKGCHKCYLLVDLDNIRAITFYQTIQYEHSTHRLLAKALNSQ